MKNLNIDFWGARGYLCGKVNQIENIKIYSSEEDVEIKKRQNCVDSSPVLSTSLLSQ